MSQQNKNDLTSLIKNSDSPIKQYFKKLLNLEYNIYIDELIMSRSAENDIGLKAKINYIKEMIDELL